MKRKINIPQKYFGSSLQLNLSEVKLENASETCIRRLMKDPKSDFNKNKFERFIIYTYEYAQILIPEYYSKFSKHTYSNTAKFTIIAMKMYLNLTYRRISEIIDVSDKIKKLLRISKAPNYSTLQKYFKNLPTRYLHEFNNFITDLFIKDCAIIAHDGTGFVSDHADKYYAIIRKKQRKSYTKCHAAIDVDSRLILNVQAINGPKHDTQFANASIRNIKQYKPKYILADKAYDTENIRTIINEEIGALDIIPSKKRVKTGYYRLRNKKIFNKKIYNRRNNIESIFSVIKRIFNGINSSRSTKLLNKETKFKCTVYNIYRSTQLNQK